MISQYSLSEFVSNVFSLIITKITINQARFIRRPIYIRGRRSLSGCKGLTTGRFCRFDLEGTHSTLFVGDSVEMGDMTHIVAYERVNIGNNVLIASKTFISDSNHGCYKGNNQDDPSTMPKLRKIVTSPVTIGNNVWIGENVVILAGTEIGDGCVIGANSVVNGKKFPANCILAGAPARIVKKYNDDAKAWESV